MYKKLLPTFSKALGASPPVGARAGLALCSLDRCSLPGSVCVCGGGDGHRSASLQRFTAPSFHIFIPHLTPSQQLACWMHFSFGKNPTWLCVGCSVSAAAWLLRLWEGNGESCVCIPGRAHWRLEGAVQLMCLIGAASLSSL